MSAHVEDLAAEAARYVAETRRLSEIGSTTEETFYPAIRDLLGAILRAQNLPLRSAPERRNPRKAAHQAATQWQ